MIKKFRNWSFALLALGFISQSANAALITMTPASQTVDLGDTTSVDVSISDFALDQYLGVFDFELIFNSAVLSLNNVTFGTGLGFSDQDALIGPGTLAIFESSLETPSFLETNQASDFVLFTLEFEAIGFGSSLVTFDTIWSLGDQFGDEIFDYTLTRASLNVPNPNAVPEPASMAILLCGLALLAWRKKVR